ncbi:MAG: substrate-binding domain-containing protein [Pseudomonadales bacterium]|nr:substrate-binding domain-containing protein [Pseudomonadales bacterium]
MIPPCLVRLLLPVLVILSTTVQASNGIYPPWSAGNNNPVTQRGLEFTVPEVDNLPDFHGNPQDSQLSILVGGNYFFAMAPLVQAFVDIYPEYRQHLYYETLPPGLLAQQIQQGGTVTVGNMTWTVHADIYAAGLKRVSALEQQGLLNNTTLYARNTLAIMIPADNPAHIHDLTDLGKPKVRVVLPNPAFEGIGRQIQQALRSVGGEALLHQVYVTKVNDGTTRLTRIHHRQTPLWLMQHQGDAGVTWLSEAIFQTMVQHPLNMIKIPAQNNITATYAAGQLRDAPHPQAAQRWLKFLVSPEAQHILQRYGFEPVQP